MHHVHHLFMIVCVKLRLEKNSKRQKDIFRFTTFTSMSKHDINDLLRIKTKLKGKVISLAFIFVYKGFIDVYFLQYAFCSYKDIYSLSMYIITLR